MCARSARSRRNPYVTLQVICFRTHRNGEVLAVSRTLISGQEERNPRAMGRAPNQRKHTTVADQKLHELETPERSEIRISCALATDLVKG